MDLSLVLLLCFGVLVLAGIYEALEARWELYRRQALLRQGEGSELRLASALSILGPTMADGGDSTKE